ncbi:transmembrane protein 41A-A-like [Centruroides vittatus]|uniref:transmembrane protein 41A-A-like n=1 Tax=Centruroides vittatus TaxID=120091 RepID=UPI00350FA310
MSKILYIPTAFIFASLWIYLLTSWAPAFENLKYPNSLEELREVSEVLKQYQRDHYIYVFILFATAYLYKQTFAIPGSVFLNILSGALFGLWKGFLLTCTLTAVGATFCFLLSKHCGKDYVVYYFPERIRFLQQKIKNHEMHLPFLLLFLRCFPMTPNWFLNMASPVVNIPIHLFIMSVFIGLMPYNFICVQTGVILTKIQSLNEVFTPSKLLSLTVIAVIALLPGFVIKKYQLVNVK